MQMTRSILAAAALALVASLSAHAQTDRKEVKKEAAAANKAGQTTGDLSAPQKADEGVTKKAKPAVTTDRAEVKKEAAAANKAGQTTGDLTPQQKAEEGVTKKQKAASTVDRKEVKKEAAAANKKGETTKGEKP